MQVPDHLVKSGLIELKDFVKFIAIEKRIKFKLLGVAINSVVLPAISINLSFRVSSMGLLLFVYSVNQFYTIKSINYKFVSALTHIV